MRKFRFFLLLFPVVWSFSSCTMEKRLYRKGWYVEHSQTIITSENNLVQANEIPENFHHSKLLVAIHKTVIDTNIIVRKRKQANGNDQTVNKTGERMTYRQAREKLAEKGTRPDDRANTLYWLSLASIPLLFVGGIGFFLAIAVLAFSKSVKEKIVATGGNCKTENIAIVDAADRITKPIVIVYLATISLAIILAVSFIATLL